MEIQPEPDPEPMFIPVGAAQKKVARIKAESARILGKPESAYAAGARVTARAMEKKNWEADPKNRGKQPTPEPEPEPEQILSDSAGGAASGENWVPSSVQDAIAEAKLVEKLSGEQILSKSNREYEIVIQNKNIPMQELRERIISIGGKIIQEESIFYHIAYSHPYNNKKKNFIRLRNEGKHITLTYKIHNNKFPVEHEIVVNNFNEANNILKLLGCKYKYECHKLREIWELEDCKEIVFDTYPGVETYAELECDSIEDIKLVLQRLNLDTNLDKYQRIIINKYYKEIYGIQIQHQSKKKKENRVQRLSFITAYDILLNQAKRNKELGKQRLDEVNEKHKEQILEIEKKYRSI